MPKKVVIVGGVAGGAAVAARLRRLDEEAEILILEKGEHVSYATCGLPYHIGGVIEDKERLFIHTPRQLEKRFNIDVRTRCEVVGIDRKNKEVKINNLDYDQSTRESYDYLLLSPGSSPVTPPIKGTGKKNVFTLNEISDAEKIMSYLRSHKPHRAVVIGAGFIGLEMVENLVEQGIRVSLIEKKEHVLPALDYEMAAALHNHLRRQKVELFLDTGVRAIVNTEEGIQISLSNGSDVPADFVIMAAGVSPNTELAEQAGLDTGKTGGILVDEYLRTSDENIYAVGDAVEVKNFVSGKPDFVPLAGYASKQGRVVANNIAGRKEKFNGVQRTTAIKMFDMIAASTGLTEEELEDIGIDYRVSYTISYHHAGYYPGATPLTIKVIFRSADGRLLGAQITGFKGVDKRIDVLSTALRYDKTVFDLQELELACAPPFGAAKDPVNIAGFAAGNILNGDVDPVQPLEFVEMEQEELQLLDVRNEIEKRIGEIEDSITIPLSELRENLDRLDRERPVLVYCANGMRSYIACRILSQNGFNEVKNLQGGYRLYSTIMAGREDIVTDAPEGKIRDGEIGKKGTEGEETVPVEDSGLDNKETADGIAGEEGDTEASDKHAGEEDIKRVDVSGLTYPHPLLTVKNSLEGMGEGEELLIETSSPAQTRDILSLCRSINLAHVKSFSAQDYSVIVEKSSPPEETEPKRGISMVVFSGEFDRVAAALLMATTAAAAGRNVHLFFTFWAVNILRKDREKNIDEEFMKNIFSRINSGEDSENSDDLSLSRIGLLGKDPEIFRRIIENRDIESLTDLIALALENGVSLSACYMSMQLMGLKRNQLIEKIDVKGYASYFESSAGEINMFV
ncbi:MAG: FAD-dependent oxidoreductase [Halanaerobiaceae bacterium]